MQVRFVIEATVGDDTKRDELWAAGKGLESDVRATGLVGVNLVDIQRLEPYWASVSKPK